MSIIFENVPKKLNH